MKPLLVGEANPHGADPEMALYPLPERASGGRLAAILGLSRGEYLERFDRCNLCPSTWSAASARRRAAEILAERAGGRIVLLGAKVSRAFGLHYRPFVHGRIGPTASVGYAVLPHPSGLNRLWNEAGSAESARMVLRAAGVLG